MNELNKLNKTENLLMKSMNQIGVMRHHMKNIKGHFLECEVNIALKKQKMKNLKRMHEFLKQYLVKWITMLKQTKEIKKKKEFAKLFSQLGSIQYDISTWSASNMITKRRNLLITDVFIRKIKNKMQKVKDNFDNIIGTIFIETKNNIEEIFYLFSTIKTVQFQNPYDEFMNCLISMFKQSILKISKDNILTLINSFNINNTTNSKEKFNIFKSVTLNENQLINIVPVYLKKLLIVAENYHNYMEKPNSSNDSNHKVRVLLYEKRELFFDIFEKKVSKILSYLYNNIPNINNNFSNKNNFLLFLTYINLFSECLKFLFCIEHSKNYMDNFIISLVKTQIQTTVKLHIRKTGIMLSGDNWKRIALQDTNEIFVSTKKNIPTQYKQLLTTFNPKAKEFINGLLSKKGKYKNITDLFNKIVDNPDIINTLCEKENEVNLFTKKFDNSKIILSTSSFSLIKSLIECVSDIILYDTLENDILIQIFNLFDYYILASVNMFMIQKSYFAQIFETIDIEETKKKNSLLTTVEFSLFLEGYMHLRKFFNITRRNLASLYNLPKIDIFTSTSDESDTKNIYFPKLNAQVLINEANVYCLLVESIVLVESIISVLKYIKHIGNCDMKQFNDKFVLYKKAIEELKSFLYKPLCGNIFRLEPIIVKMQNQKWEVDNEEFVDFSEASPFIYSLIEEIFDKYEKLNLLSGGSLTEQANIRFFDVLLKFVIERFLDSVARIKKSNSTGRSVLLKDIKLFKQKLEENFKENKKKIHLEDSFNKLILYVNSWYNRENELIAYVKETKIDYKYVLAILYYGDYFGKMTKMQRSDFVVKLEEVYYQIVTEINNVLINEMN